MSILWKLTPRIAAVLAMSFWWGGLTFYGLIVVPIGVDVLGGASEQGFITRQVSNYINLAGAGTLVVLLTSGCAIWSRAGRLTKSILAATWIVMAIAQTVLFIVHPRLDAMLDLQSNTVASPDLFHALHEFYLTVTGVQWFAGLFHLVTLLTAWQYEG
jgi:uncharacterized membrane protein